MSRVLSLLPALITAAVVLAAVLNGVDVMGAMTDGARRGMKTAADMLPALTVLFAAIYLLRASALPEMFARLAAPVLSRLGIPEETALLLLLRPLSGSGALRRGLSPRTHRRRHALLQRDDVLRHCRILRRGARALHPLGDTRRALCRRCELCRGGMGVPRTLGLTADKRGLSPKFLNFATWACNIIRMPV